jgi:hypothetical protein
MAAPPSGVTVTPTGASVDVGGAWGGPGETSDLAGYRARQAAGEMQQNADAAQRYQREARSQPSGAFSQENPFLSGGNPERVSNLAAVQWEGQNAVEQQNMGMQQRRAAGAATRPAGGAFSDDNPFLAFGNRERQGENPILSGGNPEMVENPAATSWQKNRNLERDIAELDSRPLGPMEGPYPGFTPRVEPSLAEQARRNLAIQKENPQQAASGPLPAGSGGAFIGAPSAGQSPGMPLGSGVGMPTSGPGAVGSFEWTVQNNHASANPVQLRRYLRDQAPYRQQTAYLRGEQGYARSLEMNRRADEGYMRAQRGQLGSELAKLRASIERRTSMGLPVDDLIEQWYSLESQQDPTEGLKFLGVA